MMLSRTNEGLWVLVNMLMKARKAGARARLHTPDHAARKHSLVFDPPNSSL